MGRTQKRNKTVKRYAVSYGPHSTTMLRAQANIARMEENKMLENQGKLPIVKPMSARMMAKQLRRTKRAMKPFKIKSLAKRALSTVAENGDPVEQVKELGILVKKYSDYLLRKGLAAVSNNQKNAIGKAQSSYDVAVLNIHDYLNTTIRTFGAQYVAAHGFEDIPSYEEGDNPYEDVENSTEFLSEFKETVQKHAPEMMPTYTAMMRKVASEILKVINDSLKTLGENEANNVNELSKLFAAGL